jgi:hypothetical protein
MDKSEIDYQIRPLLHIKVISKLDPNVKDDPTYILNMDWDYCDPH